MNQVLSLLDIDLCNLSNLCQTAVHQPSVQAIQPSHTSRTDSTGISPAAPAETKTTRDMSPYNQSSGSSGSMDMTQMTHIPPTTLTTSPLTESATSPTSSSAGGAKKVMDAHTAVDLVDAVGAAVSPTSENEAGAEGAAGDAGAAAGRAATNVDEAAAEKMLREGSFEDFVSFLSDGSTDGKADETADGKADNGTQGADGSNNNAAGDDGELVVSQLPPIQRRLSSEKREERKNCMDHLADSTATIDSWDGKAGALPPLMPPKRSSLPDLYTGASLTLGKNDDDLCDDDEPQDRPAAIKSKSVVTRTLSDCEVGTDPNRLLHTLMDKDEDDDAGYKYINIPKLMRSSSTDYPIAHNPKARKLYEKYQSTRGLEKTKMTRHASFADADIDASAHSAQTASSLLNMITRESSYRGPTPKMKNGGAIKSAMKKPGSKNNLKSSVLSEDSCLFSAGEDELNSDGSNRSGANSRSSSGVIGTPKQMKRNISFSSVDIREHERIAGDNPCVTSGVPLSIGWRFMQHDPIDLNEYETNKGPARDKIEMMVPASVRRQMLREEFGVSIKEMNASMKLVNITKRNRRNTIAAEHLEGWTEVLQSAKRKFKRAMKRTSTAKEEEKLWETAHKSALKQYLEREGEGSLGNDPEGWGVGKKGQGPVLVVEGKEKEGAGKDENPPFLEISFNENQGDEVAPEF